MTRYFTSCVISDPGFSGRYKQLDEARKRAQQKELEEEEASARVSAQQRKEQREDRGQRGLEDEGSEASSSSPQLKAAAPVSGSRMHITVTAVVLLSFALIVLYILTQYQSTSEIGKSV